MALFNDRAGAGRKLAQALEKYRKDEPVILALPRGGVPVGYEVARSLQAPLDVLLVRKIGAPLSSELAAGAIVDGSEIQVVRNEDVIRMQGIPEDYLQEEQARQLAEIERRRILYRAGRPAVNVAGKTAIVVDDGIATGATMRVALRALRKRHPGKLVMAVPVGSFETIESFREEADDVICLERPHPFWGVGQFYDDFSQTEDAEVIRLLDAARNFGKEKPA